MAESENSNIMTTQPRIGVVGSGSFGTAIVKILCENLTKVNWWVRNNEVKSYLKLEHRNPNYLSDVEFDYEQLNVTTSINTLVKNSDYIILVTPSIYLVDSLSKLKLPINEKQMITAIKGIVPQEGKIVGDYLHDSFNVPYENIGVITGPCHAEEIALERLSYLTLAFKEEEKADDFKKNLECRYVKVTTSDDIIGTEYASVLKNIYAISAGISHGLGYGDNFLAVLMSNAIREMETYLKKTHPLKRDIKNSAYLGDLLVTGYSYFSRNRMFGNMIGKGYTVQSALMEMNMVPEGYYATEGIYNLMGDEKIKMPILKTVYRILYENKSPKKQFKKLTKKLN